MKALQFLTLRMYCSNWKFTQNVITMTTHWLAASARMSERARFQLNRGYYIDYTFAQIKFDHRMIHCSFYIFTHRRQFGSKRASYIESLLFSCT